MRAVVINLPRAADRRRRAAETFRVAGVDYEFFAATDWRCLTDSDLRIVDREERARQGRRPLSLGMIACWLSHRRVREAFVAGRESRLAVFEDDVELTDDAGDVLSHIEETPIPFDVIFLHRNKSRDRFRKLVTLSASHDLGVMKFSDWGAQGYVLSRAGAERLLSFYPRIVHRNDHSIHAYWDHGLRTYTLNPPIVVHRSGLRSVLGEASRPRRQRAVPSLIQRAQSVAAEEVRRRRAFRRRLAERER